MNFGLIIVGDEILSGKRADKHLPKVIELLGERGMALAWARYVGDVPARITADLRDAFASGDAVFCCGGIGAHGANYLGPEHSGVQLGVDPKNPLPFAAPGGEVFR